MAKTTAGTTPDFEPGRQYLVTLARPVQWRPGVWLRPGEALKLDGAVCNEIKAALLSAKEA